jgi:hypothetical protein
MGTLPQGLDIIFEVQRKMSNENITRKKKLSNLQNMVLFSLDYSYFQTS